MALVLSQFMVFAFGTIVGSFLNVVILRYGTGRTVIGGRSLCASCGRALRWFELIPVASFILQRGRCRSCRSRLSWQYPLVEFATGLIFLGIFLKLDLHFAIYNLQFLSHYFILHTSYFTLSWCLLIVIFVYDLRHKIIPDQFVYSFSILTLAATLARGPELYDLLAGPIFFAFFFLIWCFSRGRWMGLGDAKLALGLGWFLGLYEGIGATLLAFWVGAAVSVGLILCGRLNLISKRFTMKSEIPFGPFLVVGAATVFFFDLNVIDLLVPFSSLLNYEL